ESIDVRPFLPVHLYRYEMGIEYPCDIRVPARGPSHHVAPVAGGRPDREAYGFILRGSVCKRLVSPCIPFHRVPGMLEQIGAYLVDKPVRSLSPLPIIGIPS